MPVTDVDPAVLDIIAKRGRKSNLFWKMCLNGVMVSSIAPKARDV